MIGEGVFTNFVNTSRDDIFAKFVIKTLGEITKKIRNEAIYMDAVFKVITDTQQRISSCEGWRITEKIEILQVSYNIFMGNFNELHSVLIEYQSNEKLVIELMKRENPELLNHFLKDTIRLLHNYLAAAKTLVDHTRVFAQEEYEGTEFWQEYDSAIGSHFREVSIARFIQDLRNYILHKTLPLTSAEITWERDSDMKSSIKLDINTLREWDRWSAKAKEYLNDLKEKEDLIDIIDRYKAIVENFYDWFGEKQKDLHSSALEELKDLQEQLKTAYIKAGYGDFLK